MHALQQHAGKFFNVFCKFISFFGKAGWAFIVFAIIFLLFKARRREGLAMAIALLFGAIVTNIILKNAVARPRPYTRVGTPFDLWWADAGCNTESSWSFPSGHTTAAFSSMVALFIVGNKRVTWIGLLFAFIMAFSRVYLIVHYPSDVLFGIIIGTAAAFGGAALSKLIYKKAGGKFRNVLYDFDIIALFKNLIAKRKNAVAANAAEETSVEIAELTAEQNGSDATETDTPQNNG